jgi:ATP-dependent RNA helicase RhlE
MSHLQSFRALGASEPVIACLTARGIYSPFAIQELVLPDALAGLDVLAKSPTGSGKTLAFGIPLVERTDARAGRPTALVLVPTRELASQVADELSAIAAVKGLTVAAAYGGVAVRAQARAVAAAHILVATPGRLEDLAERRAVDLRRVTALILDEADRMLDMGFKPQVDRLVRRLPRNRQTMFFSATLEREVGELARAYTTNPSRYAAGLPPQLDDGPVEHRFVPVNADTKVATLAELVGQADGSVLVFVRTKRGADRLVQKLDRHGVGAVALHGDMAQGARERALGRFVRGEVTTLVATDVAARGLDLLDVTHVVNFDPPEEGNAYVHRVGRTGRAGHGGTGITLVLPEQQADVGRVASVLGHGEQFDAGGLERGRPKLVYSGRGRGSRWGRASGPRRKI